MDGPKLTTQVDRPTWTTQVDRPKWTTLSHHVCTPAEAVSEQEVELEEKTALYTVYTGVLRS